MCEGAPLRSAEKRQKALEDGYDVDRRFDCITKESFAATAGQRARYEAANTPEAKAAEAARLEREHAASGQRLESQGKAEGESRSERERQLAQTEQTRVDPVEINTASEAQLAAVPGIGAGTAREIVAARAKGAFTGWEDVVRRVSALGAAETAARASAFGITVDGGSLKGAEPDSPVGRIARHKWRRRS